MNGINSGRHERGGENDEAGNRDVSLGVRAQGAYAQTVSIGTNPQGSLAYATGAGVAKVAIEAGGVNMRVVPQGGPVVTLPLANNGELDFTISNIAASSFAYLGKGTFEARSRATSWLVAVLFPLYSAFYVRNDSDIKTLSDLKGKRVPTKFTKQKIVGYNAQSVLATVGLSFKDVAGVPVPNGVRGVRDFMEGKNDAAFFSVTSGITRQAHAAVGASGSCPWTTRPRPWRHCAASCRRAASRPSSPPSSIPASWARPMYTWRPLWSTPAPRRPTTWCTRW